MRTIHEAGTAEGEEEDMLYNLAYGKTMDGGEEELTGLPKLRGQCEAADVKLEGNESYNTIPPTPAQDDEGEYAYPAISVISPA